MTLEQFRAVQSAQPFRPYLLKLADGNTLAVNHPEWVSHSPSGRTIVLWKPDDSFEIVDLLLIVSIEVSNGQVAKPSNQPRTN